MKLTIEAENTRALSQRVSAQAATTAERTPSLPLVVLARDLPVAHLAPRPHAAVVAQPTMRRELHL